jgi:hypothetical protein
VPDAILTDRCQPAPYSGRMFERDLTTITLATPERLWPLYTDVSRWPEWDEAVVQVTLDGPFASGLARSRPWNDGYTRNGWAEPSKLIIRPIARPAHLRVHGRGGA